MSAWDADTRALAAVEKAERGLRDADAAASAAVATTASRASPFSTTPPARASGATTTTSRASATATAFSRGSAEWKGDGGGSLPGSATRSRGRSKPGGGVPLPPHLGMIQRGSLARDSGGGGGGEAAERSSTAARGRKDGVSVPVFSASSVLSEQLLRQAPRSRGGPAAIGGAH